VILRAHRDAVRGRAGELPAPAAQFDGTPADRIVAGRRDRGRRHGAPLGMVGDDAFAQRIPTPHMPLLRRGCAISNFAAVAPAAQIGLRGGDGAACAVAGVTPWPAATQILGGIDKFWCGPWTSRIQALGHSASRARVECALPHSECATRMSRRIVRDLDPAVTSLVRQGGGARRCFGRRTGWQSPAQAAPGANRGNEIRNVDRVRRRMA